jgi:DNA polymerase-3 subunit delta'
MEFFEGGAALSHAVIIWGGSESDRNGSAEHLAMEAVCAAPGKRPCLTCHHCVKASRGIHPDIIVVDRREDKQNLLVDQVRTIREDAVVLPNEAQKKVYIIRHADLMNQQAQNALLMVLEEPPESSRFILVAENPAGLLPTVRSRCVELRCRQTDVGMRENETVAAFEAALTGGAPKLNAFSYTLEKLDRNSFAEFLDGAVALLTRRLREVMTSGRGVLGEAALTKALRVLKRAKEYADVNVGLMHLAGMICAELMQTEELEEYDDRSYKRPI